MSIRTAAREVALKALYQADIHRQLARQVSPSVDDFESFIADCNEDPAVREYARFLVAGVLSRTPELDRQIAEVTEHWHFDRTATIDRCVLRIGLFELLESPEVPPKVAIDEAINLVKRYSGERSGAFVNGILDRLFSELSEGGTEVSRE